MLTNTVPALNDHFFITGGTLPTDATCYITRQADEALCASLTRGDFCYVLNTRQMGKSSLMVRTAQRLRQENACVVVLDLTSIGQNLTMEQWYFGLLVRMGEQIGVEEALTDYWRQNRERGALQRWLDAIREVVLPTLDPSEPLVVFIDEIDAVRSLPFSTDEFFAGIRECYNRRTLDPLFHRLTFCLLGVATPADLIRNARLSPFNIGERILLTDFAPQEAAALAKGIAGMPEERAWRLVHRVLYWTGGHPYITQRLCRAVAEQNAQTEREVDHLCEAMFLSRDAVETDDNLAFVRNRLLQSDCDLASLLDLYQRVRAGKPVPDDETNPLCSALRLSGVARSVQGQLQLRNRIYDHVFDRRWVQAHMPDAELRRQRRAYQRGLLRAASAAAVLIVLFAVLAGIAGFQARAARRARDQAQRNLQEARRQQARANGLNGQLQTTLQQKEEVNRRLQTALSAERTQRQQADDQRQAAQTARGNAETRRREAEQARQEAQRQQRLATAQLRQNYLATGLSAMESGDLLAALPPLRNAMKLDQGDPLRMQIHRIRLASVLGQSPRSRYLWRFPAHLATAQFSPDGKCILTAGADGSAQIWDAASGQAVMPPLRHGGAILTAAYSPDGKRIVTGGADHRACLWDAATGTRLAVFLLPAPALCVAWTHDNQRFLTGCPGHISQWRASARGLNRTPLFDTTAPGGIITGLALAPDDSRMATIFGNFIAWLNNAQTGAELFPLGATRNAPDDARCYRASHVEYSPDGRRLAIAGMFGRVNYLWGACLYDAETGRALLPVFQHPQFGTYAHFSPDGQRIVTASEDGTARIWSAANGQPLTPWLRHVSRINSARFSPDGSRLLIACDDGSVYFHDGTTGEALGSPLHEAAGIQMAAFDRSGQDILTVNRNSTVHLWQIPDHDPDSRLVVRPDDMDISNTRLIAQGTRLVTMLFHSYSAIYYDYFPRVYDTASGKLLFQLPGEPIGYSGFTVSRDERTICLFSKQVTRVWNLQTRLPLTPLLQTKRTYMSPDAAHLLFWKTEHDAELRGLHTGRTYRLRAPMPDFFSQPFSPQGRFLALRTAPDTVRIFDCKSGQWRAGSLPCHEPLELLRYSLREDRLFVITKSGRAQLWDTSTGRCLRESPALYAETSRMALTFSPDRRYAVTYMINPESQALFWDVQTGHLLGQHALFCNNTPLVWKPDDGKPGNGKAHTGNALFAVGGAQPRLWDASRGRAATLMLAHNAEVSAVAFDADGSRLVTASADGTARVWNARNGSPLAPPMHHQGRVLSAEFSPDGHYVLTGGEDGTARLWSAETAEAVTPPARYPGPVSTAKFLGRGDAYIVLLKDAVYRERIRSR